jgi:hypothetical protein
MDARAFPGTSARRGGPRPDARHAEGGQRLAACNGRAVLGDEPEVQRRMALPRVLALEGSRERLLLAACFASERILRY